MPIIDTPFECCSASLVRRVVNLRDFKWSRMFTDCCSSEDREGHRAFRLSRTSREGESFAQCW